MKCMTEETFGPTLPIMKVQDSEEALALANDSEYGLQASVWTKDADRGAQLAARIEAGAANVNEHQLNYLALEAPMGGWKSSGLGTRHGAQGIRKYTRQQVSVIAAARDEEGALHVPVQGAHHEAAGRPAQAAERPRQEPLSTGVREPDSTFGADLPTRRGCAVFGSPWPSLPPAVTAAVAAATPYGQVAHNPADRLASQADRRLPLRPRPPLLPAPQPGRQRHGRLADPQRPRPVLGHHALRAAVAATA